MAGSNVIIEQLDMATSHLKRRRLTVYGACFGKNRPNTMAGPGSGCCGRGGQQR
jgi:hypothetical protein